MPSDTSLFIYNSVGVVTYILIYVDDIIMTSLSSGAITTLLHDSQSEFALKDLGQLHYFLRIEVKNMSNGLLLSQSKYISEVLSRARMVNCKPVTTPMAVTEMLSLTRRDPSGTTDA